MAEDKLSAYIEDDAERWTAVHMRIQGLQVVTLAIFDALSTLNPELNRMVTARLRHALDVMRKDQPHPAEMQEVLVALDAIAGPDPKPETNPKRGH